MCRGAEKSLPGAGAAVRAMQWCWVRPRGCPPRAGMPEEPLVRTFHHLVSPFVGKQVIKTEATVSLQSLWLQDTQVHGKKLFLRCDPDEEMGPADNSPPPEPPRKETQKEGTVGPKQPREPTGQKTLDAFSLSTELVPRGEDDYECLEGDTPVGDAGRWLPVALVCLAAFG